jgi:hypothetical protein
MLYSVICTVPQKTNHMQSVILTDERNPGNAALTAVLQWERELCGVQKYKRAAAKKQTLKCLDDTTPSYASVGLIHQPIRSLKEIDCARRLRSESWRARNSGLCRSAQGGTQWCRRDGRRIPTRTLRSQTHGCGRECRGNGRYGRVDRPGK